MPTVFCDHKHHVIVLRLNNQLQTNHPHVPWSHMLTFCWHIFWCSALLYSLSTYCQTRAHQEFEDMLVSPQFTAISKPPAQTLNLTRTKKGQETLHFLWKVQAPPGLSSARWSLLLLISNSGSLSASQQIQMGTEGNVHLTLGGVGRLESHGTIAT